MERKENRIGRKSERNAGQIKGIKLKLEVENEGKINFLYMTGKKQRKWRNRN